MDDPDIFEEDIKLVRDVFVLSLQFSEMFNIDIKQILTSSFDELFNIHPQLSNLLLTYPDNKIKINSLKQILKIMDEPTSGNKDVLYKRVCRIIDKWRLNFNQNFIKKYV